MQSKTNTCDEIMETTKIYPTFIFVRERKDKKLNWSKYNVFNNKQGNPMIDKKFGECKPSLLNNHNWRTAICQTCNDHVYPPDVKCEKCKKEEREIFLSDMSSVKACRIMQCEPARVILKKFDQHSFIDFDYDLAKNFIISQETFYHKKGLHSKPSIVVAYSIYWAGLYSKDVSKPFYSKDRIMQEMGSVGNSITIVTPPKYIKKYRLLLKGKNKKYRRRYSQNHPFKTTYIEKNHYIVEA